MEGDNSGNKEVTYHMLKDRCSSISFDFFISLNFSQVFSSQYANPKERKRQQLVCGWMIPNFGHNMVKEEPPLEQTQTNLSNR